MSRHLILVRHSLPEIQDDQPAREWKLSEEGRLRAERLAEKLRPFSIDILVSSKEPKAVETAQILATAFHVPLLLAEGLHEHERDNVPFLSRSQFEQSVRSFFEQPNMLVFGSETADQAQARFSATVHSILTEHGEKSVTIVAHGTVLSLFVSRLIGCSGYLFWKELGLPSFVVLDMKSNKIVARENIQ